MNGVPLYAPRVLTTTRLPVVGFTVAPLRRALSRPGPRAFADARVAGMEPAAALATDLLTPLAAYLHLREEGRASFLLESVEQGRLGRNSWLGGGSRLVDFEEAAALDRPVVGYLGYEAGARFEPSVPVPADGSKRAPAS